MFPRRKGRKVFEENEYYGYILKGDLVGAIRYVKRFPEQSVLYQRYINLFDKEQYLNYAIDEPLGGILRAYQQYYRDAFYLRLDKDKAAERLQIKLAALLHVNDKYSLDEMEQEAIAGEFQRRRFCFLGGKTGGYYGPYVWKTTEIRTYDVELPDGVQPYTVKLLDGFVVKSWLDYLSFGKVSTGGWTDTDGIINCVKSSYDFDSENFRVSLLKHEAQHARDLTLSPGMPSAMLEYRAKLVELIYSTERNLLAQFVREADSSDDSNGHSVAAHRIVSEYCKLLDKSSNDLDMLSVEQAQSVAKSLFEKSLDKTVKELIQKLSKTID